MAIQKMCNHAEDPDAVECLKVADPAYAMDFTDVEPGLYLNWCSHCGPYAHKVRASLGGYLRENPEQVSVWEAELDRTEAEREPDARLPLLQ